MAQPNQVSFNLSEEELTEAKMHIDRLKAIYDDLATRFPGRPKKSEGGPEA